MNVDNIFCAYKKCTNITCLRHYKRAPDNNKCSWFAITPNENGTCLYFVPKNK